MSLSVPCRRRRLIGCSPPATPQHQRPPPPRCQPHRRVASSPWPSRPRIHAPAAPAESRPACTCLHRTCSASVRGRAARGRGSTYIVQTEQASSHDHLLTTTALIARSSPARDVHLHLRRHLSSLSSLLLPLTVLASPLERGLSQQTPAYQESPSGRPSTLAPPLRTPPGTACIRQTVAVAAQAHTQKAVESLQIESALRIQFRKTPPIASFARLAASSHRSIAPRGGTPTPGLASRHYCALLRDSGLGASGKVVTIPLENGSVPGASGLRRSSYIWHPSHSRTPRCTPRQLTATARPRRGLAPIPLCLSPIVFGPANCHTSYYPSGIPYPTGALV
ncbi:hypothetical protein K505DRAFT_344494 [Melanomma pulvis-pyrius CBS 109.77]|uniref:Uncharacterized protein n=1 Tax=Melanomma pulvis-pyrius CBS 109.77 TaxID=1314802 RepID=A0A6A6WNU8_9PLEO|nr:hypothetical protein K505DRAFT_344494 [Melanomma pulvis-pyrius CBS 109.77]